MEYRQIGNSGLKVSAIGLGGNNFAGRLDESKSIEVISHALELGVNFIDTAAAYSVGRSEETIGKAIEGKRSKVIIATKFGANGQITPDQQRGSRIYILKSIENSLRRLNTDYIDLYLVHSRDSETPMLETLETLDGLVRAGKVRYIGCSGGFAPWHLCDAMWISKTHNLTTFVTAGGSYNMIDRAIEQEMVPCCQKFGVGFTPTVPLAGGFLTGKYHRGQQPSSGFKMPKNRAGIASLAPSLNPRDLSAELTDENFIKLEKLQVFAEERGHRVGELAIAWLLSHSWVNSMIAGAMTKEQVSANVASGNWKLTAADLTQSDQIL